MKSYSKFINENKTEWSTIYKPKTLETLSQIDAPEEWKKKVLAAAKLSYTAWGACNLRGMKSYKAFDIYGNKWCELMKEIGNPEYNFGVDNLNFEYWKQYTELSGKSISFTFDDCLA